MQGVTTDIYKGDVVAIIGPSGCGKSTFLRCLNFLEMPSAGEIRFNGEIIYKNERVYLKRQMKGLLALKKTKQFDEEAKAKYTELESEYKALRVSEKEIAPRVLVAKPRVLIPVFPGTNCEFDSAKVMRDAGAEADIFVINNLTKDGITKSTEDFAKKLRESQMVFVPGGFSGGDEPDGSGKFIMAFFRNEAVKNEIHSLLGDRDGLMCGICNGFQALVKLGLVPYGRITEADANAPTLTFNNISRHQSKLVRTRIASNKSPWLSATNVGDVYTVPISHGEGKFLSTEEQALELARNGQIATQYVDLNGNPTSDIRYNPNGSTFAIEGITSPDGRVLGTQTGLRGLPRELWDFALSIEGDRYEYEMNLLMTAADKKFELVMRPIRTSYFDDNKKSHFRTIQDSYLVYKRPIRFALASLSSSVVDLALFTLLIHLVFDRGVAGQAMAATVIARCLSGIYNFVMNKKWSFSAKGSALKQGIRYFILWLAIMVVSGGVVDLLRLLPMDITLLKLIVDCLLFIVSYVAQRVWVFKT